MPTPRQFAFDPANFAIVRLESPEMVAGLVNDAVARYQPLCSQERFAVERIALAELSLLRCTALESGLFTNCLDEAMEIPGNPPILRSPEITNGLEIALGQHRSYWLAAGFKQVAGATQHNSVTVFLRYQAQAERMFRRAVEEFGRLKALRHELTKDLPNEPIAEPQPTETTPIRPRNEPACNPSGAPPHPLQTSPFTRAARRAAQIHCRAERRAAHPRIPPRARIDGIWIGRSTRPPSRPRSNHLPP